MPYYSIDALMIESPDSLPRQPLEHQKDSPQTFIYDVVGKFPLVRQDIQGF